MNYDVQYFISMGQTILMSFGVQFIQALIILFVGFKVANLIVSTTEKTLEKKNIDPSLRPFLVSVLSWLIKLAVFVSAITTLGIKTTSFVALLGTIGLAIGMALQGSLSNFAGGVLILLLKPFKVGDVITAQGFTGTVDKITTFSTYLKTGDNRVISIPNGGLANSPVININHEATRRVDFTFGIGYEDDIDKARAIISELIEKDERSLKDQNPSIFVGELADSSVNFIVRVWTKTSDYWGFHFDLIENVKKEFDKQNISIPYPQQEVHIKSNIQ